MTADPPKTATAFIVVDSDSLETGQWCDTCQLPSRITAAALWLDDHGCGPLGHISICPDCAESADERNHQ